MKKNFAIIATLLVAFMGTLGLVTNAQNTEEAEILLEIEDGIFSCSEYPTEIDFGTYTASPTTGTLDSDDTWEGRFICTNYLSERTSPVTAQSTTLMGDNSSYAIPAINITWTPSELYFYERGGDCFDMEVGDGGTLDTAREIIIKNGNTLICDFEYQPSSNDGEMTVIIPAYAPVDSYKAVMTITDAA